MNDANKNIRSEEVEEALKILESDGEEAMDAYLIPRGQNWIELNVRLLREEVLNLENCFFNLRHGIQYTPDVFTQLPSFRSAIVCAVRITKLADAIKDIFQTHFGVFLDEENKEQRE